MIDFMDEMWDAIKRHPVGAITTWFLIGVGRSIGDAVWRHWF